MPGASRIVVERGTREWRAGVHPITFVAQPVQKSCLYLLRTVRATRLDNFFWLLPTDRPPLFSGPEHPGLGPLRHIV